MRKILLIILLYAATTSVQAKGFDFIEKTNWSPWPDKSLTKNQKIITGVNVFLHIADYTTSKYILIDECDGKCVGRYKEGNPLFGEHPSNGELIAGKLLFMYLQNVLVNNVQPKNRWLILGAITVVQTAVVTSNALQQDNEGNAVGLQLGGVF